MVLAALLLTPLIGEILLPRKLEVGLAGRLGLAFALGAAALSVQMFLYDLSGIPWSRASVLAPWAGAWAAHLYAEKPWRRFPAWRRPDPWVVAGALLTLPPLLVWLPWERLMPLTVQNWDAWAIWLLKAKAFYLDGGVSPFLSRIHEFNTQPGYPLLVPLYGTWLYTAAGGVQDNAAKLMTPLFYLALLGVFYGLAGRCGERRAAALFTAMLASAPIAGHAAFAHAGYADTPLSVYILAAGGFLYAWHGSDRLRDLGLASVSGTAAAWTKNEGLPVLAAVAALAAARLFLRRASRRAWAALLTPPLAVLGPWIYVRETHEIAAADFVPLLQFEPELFWVSLQAMTAAAARPSLANLTFYLFAAALAAAVVLKLRRPFWLLPGFVFLHLGAALLAYATGRNEIDWWLQSSLDRILAQIVPLALLTPALVFSTWSQRVKERLQASEEQAAAQASGGGRGKRRGGRRRP